MMDALTERQKVVLMLVIHEHIRSAAPVGSENLVKHYRLDMSPATVRNEMGILTEQGYLRQPHTSAGRVPTEEGYRYFVGKLLNENDLPVDTRRMISHQFYQMRNDIEQWMRLAASVLASQSHAASVVTAPHPDLARIKHVELIATRGRQVLMIVVMVGGEVHQRLITLGEVVAQEQLSSAATNVTQVVMNKDASAIEALKSQFNGLEADLVKWLLEETRYASTLTAGEVYLDGLTNVLAEPEFSGPDDARKALRIIEERSLLQDLLSKTVLSEETGGVQVLIGGEGTWDDLRQCSVILARYGTPGLITGTLGVLGPIRMSYGRTISTVRFVAGLLSEMVDESLAS
jgi:heat-inducible transcriptional repressor